MSFMYSALREKAKGRVILVQVHFIYGVCAKRVYVIIKLLITSYSAMNTVSWYQST